MPACNLCTFAFFLSLSIAIWPKQWRFSFFVFPFSPTFLHTPPHAQTASPPLTSQWKVSAPEVELSQICLGHKRWESAPWHTCVCVCARVFVCVSVATLGVSWIGEIWPSTPWPVHTNGAFNPAPLLSTMTALVYSHRPAKEAKCIIYHFAYYSPPTFTPQHLASFLLPSPLFCHHRLPLGFFSQPSSVDLDFWSWIWSLETTESQHDLEPAVGLDLLHPQIKMPHKWVHASSQSGAATFFRKNDHHFSLEWGAAAHYSVLGKISLKI